MTGIIFRIALAAFWLLLAGLLSLHLTQKATTAECGDNLPPGATVLECSTVTVCGDESEAKQ